MCKRAQTRCPMVLGARPKKERVGPSKYAEGVRIAFRRNEIVGRGVCGACGTGGEYVATNRKKTWMSEVAQINGWDSLTGPKGNSLKRTAW